MEMQEVDITIGPDGAMQVTVRGVKGPACLGITEGMERLLGGQVSTRVETGEMQEAPVGESVPDRVTLRE